MTGQMTFAESMQGTEHPNVLLANALTWIEDNPEAWSWIVGAAQRDALDGVPVSTKFYIETLRRDRSLPWATAAVKLPNSYSPAFARILRQWHPEVASHVRVEASKLDGCVIPPRPY